MKAFLLLTTFILVLDIIWLTAMKPGYQTLVKAVQHAPLSVKFLPAIASYACVIASIYFFAIPVIATKIKKGTSITEILKLCVIYGGGLGFVVYGVFNFTNLAIFKGYSSGYMAVFDLVWGTFLYTASTMFYFTTLLKSKSA